MKTVKKAAFNHCYCLIIKEITDKMNFIDSLNKLTIKLQQYIFRRFQGILTDNYYRESNYGIFAIKIIKAN